MMKTLMENIEHFNVICFDHLYELEQLNLKHQEEKAEILHNITQYEDCIFPAARKLLISKQYTQKCLDFTNNYGTLTEPIRAKFQDESLDIGGISMKLDCDGVVCRIGTEIIYIIPYDEIEWCLKPDLRIVKNNS